MSDIPVTMQESSRLSSRLVLSPKIPPQWLQTLIRYELLLFLWTMFHPLIRMSEDIPSLTGYIPTCSCLFGPEGLYIDSRYIFIPIPNSVA